MSSSNNLLDAWATLLAQMQEKSINQVFAENLAAAMRSKDLNQVALAAKAKVSQKTVSNCLNPGNRSDTASGKESSVSLTNLQLIADALGAEPWQLLRPLNQKQREIYERFDDLVRVMQTDDATTRSDVVTIQDKKKTKASSKYQAPAQNHRTTKAA